jgi:hypothetical protein
MPGLHCRTVCLTMGVRVSIDSATQEVCDIVLESIYTEHVGVRGKYQSFATRFTMTGTSPAKKYPQ